ncbi:MAG: DNA methyltransferase [Oscillatoria sp. PMC 1051.18]|nr:DNA methyltransferase [Oscillatoria sp. PMC 1050.18]MEC5032430.1 DNA methyltransferase [Oscillatoria sp. PMC 1051.18]
MSEAFDMVKQSPASSRDLTQLFQTIDNFTCDRQSIPQEKLDLNGKSRTSIFPWRGQFSPQLVEVFLNYYAEEKSVIFDPFVGSGTTLFESARKGLTCYAAEINPAAVAMAKSVNFVNLNLPRRQKIIEATNSIVTESLRPFEWNLFSYQQQNQVFVLKNNNSKYNFLATLIQKNKQNCAIHNLLVNAAIRYDSNYLNQEITYLQKAVYEQSKIITSLPFSKQKYQLFHQDARKVSLPNNSVDLIITSPPYINVFNYHQNNRQIMEALGWDLLKIAKSEIGSNRKNRQNRFLTVIQYALDMLDVFQEMRRLLCPHGRAIIVIGRESKVRRMKINNTRIIAALALGSGTFKLDIIQERKFKNKFGEVIYEDILHLIPTSLEITDGDEFARLVGQWILQEIKPKAERKVLQEIVNAQERANLVKKSPIFELTDDYLTANFT